EQSKGEKVSIVKGQSSQLIACDYARLRRGDGLVSNALTFKLGLFYFVLGAGSGSHDRLLLERGKNHALITDVDGDAGTNIDLVAAAGGGEAIAFRWRHFSEVIGAIGAGGGGTGESQRGIVERDVDAGRWIARSVVHGSIHH